MVEPTLQTRGQRGYDAPEGGDTLSKAAKKKKEKRDRAKRRARRSRLRKRGENAMAQRDQIEDAAGPGAPGGRKPPL
jgi:hypothetical protein